MKTLILFLALSVKALAITCTAAQVTLDLSGNQTTYHNSVQVWWTSDTTAGFHRIQFGTTTSYGQSMGTGQTVNTPAGQTIIGNITSLSPSTLYHAAAESSADGVTFCTGTDFMFTTAALPAGGHPVYPTPPTAFNYVDSAITGTVWLLDPLRCASYSWAANFPSASGCKDFVSDPTLTDTLQHAIGTNVGPTPCNAKYGDGIIGTKGTVIASPSHATPLTFADACDALGTNGNLNVTNVDTAGLFTTSAAHGLSAGNIVRMGLKNGFGTASEGMPLPFQAGFPYCVIASGLDATHFKVSLACGGSALHGTSNMPYNGCLIAGASLPVEQYITIRTSASDAELPPAGVRIASWDPITYTVSRAYESKLAIIKNTTTLPAGDSSAVAFNQGCQAHHYRLVGIQFQYASVGSVGETDGNMYLGFLTSGYSNFNIVCDRCWAKGGAYPERDLKFWVFADGSNIGWVNSFIENINGWTPSNSYQLTNAATGTATQTMTGTLYKGQSKTDTCPNHPTFTITAGTSGIVAWEVKPDCTNNLIAQTGLTIGCSDSSGAPCSGSPSASPDYTKASGLYTNFPIATMAVSGGHWTGNSFLGEGLMIQGGAINEGGLVFGVNYGPGPTLFDNNLVLNSIGINLYWPADNSQVLSIACITPGGNIGCEYRTPPSDATISRNDIITDYSYVADVANPVWNGQFFSGRQPFELKEVVRAKIIGNRIDGSFCVNGIRGPAATLSALTDAGSLYYTTQKVSDIEFGYNVFSNTCDGVQFQSYYPAYEDVDVAMQRVWIHDQIHFGINPQKWIAKINSGGSNGQQQGTFQAPSDFLVEHNFWDVSIGPDPVAFTMSCGHAEGWVYRNNFISFSNDSSHNGAHYSHCDGYAEVPDNGGQNAGTAITNNLVASTFPSNWFVGGYQTSNTWPTVVDMDSSQITTATSAWSGVTGANFVTGNTLAARIASMKLVNYGAAVFSPQNYSLRGDSNFQSGGANKGNDGLAIGPNTDQISVHHGDVQGARALAIGTTTATVAFYAPDTTGCTVDWSSDGFSTWTRVANAGGARAQSVSLTGLTTKTAYQARVNCQTQQPIVSFVTH